MPVKPQLEGSSHRPCILPCPAKRLATLARWGATRHPERQFGLWRLNHVMGLISEKYKYCALVGADSMPFEVDMTQGGFEILIAGWRVEEVRGALKGLPRDAICVDVGAHWGTWSRTMSSLFPDGTIYAFEASSSTFELLKRNCSRVTNICCIQSAVGLKTGTVPFATRKVMACLRSIQVQPGYDTEHVPCVSLLDWIRANGLKRLDFLKVDVEGFEEDVILPAIDLLMKLRTRICFEFIPEMAAGRSPLRGESLLPELRSAGFRIYRLDQHGGWHSELSECSGSSNNYIATVENF